jgi:hypothetical protein
LLIATPGFADDELPMARELHEPAAEHVDQHAMVELVRAGDLEEAFEMAFDGGDELFETHFNAVDGVGANVGKGERFTHVPRADLRGFGEWANHVPARETGPNAANCNACHNVPFDDGAGLTASNVHRDPTHGADVARFIQRNTPHVFSPGSIQRLAEEMTVTLEAIRTAAGASACATGRSSTRPLTAKGVSFGSITANPRRGTPCATFDTTRVAGVDRDLVVRPFQWKGSVASLRNFNRDASHNEIGMQAVELVGAGLDGDGDQVVDEMTIGDQTALAVYLAAQPRAQRAKASEGQINDPARFVHGSSGSLNSTRLSRNAITSCCCAFESAWKRPREPAASPPCSAIAPASVVARPSCR